LCRVARKTKRSMLDKGDEPWYNLFNPIGNHPIGLMYMRAMVCYGMTMMLSQHTTVVITKYRVTS
jgi:hypothetical protein